MTWRGWIAALSFGMLAGCTTLRVVPPVTVGPSDEAAAWPFVLRQAVDGQGRVNFRSLAAQPGALQIAVASIAQTAPNNAPERFATLHDRLAFHINAYNALAMYAVVQAGIPERLSLLGRVKFFKLTRLVVGGQPIALYDYENDVIRPLGEERVHFALNCMAVSCPILPQTPFTAARLDEGLDAAARQFFAEPRNVQVDPARRVVRLSSILNFYPEDFLRRAPSLIAYANRYRAEPIPADYKVEFIPYDWTINAQPRP